MASPVSGPGSIIPKGTLAPTMGKPAPSDPERVLTGEVRSSARAPGAIAARTRMASATTLARESDRRRASRSAAPVKAQGPPAGSDRGYRSGAVVAGRRRLGDGEAERLCVCALEPGHVGSEGGGYGEEPLVARAALKRAVVVRDLLGVTQLVLGQSEDEGEARVHVGGQRGMDRRVGLARDREQSEVAHPQGHERRDVDVAVVVGRGVRAVDVVAGHGGVLEGGQNGVGVGHLDVLRRACDQRSTLVGGMRERGDRHPGHRVAVVVGGAVVAVGRGIDRGIGAPRGAGRPRMPHRPHGDHGNRARIAIARRGGDAPLIVLEEGRRGPGPVGRDLVQRSVDGRVSRVVDHRGDHLAGPADRLEHAQLLVDRVVPVVAGMGGIRVASERARESGHIGRAPSQRRGLLGADRLTDGGLGLGLDVGEVGVGHSPPDPDVIRSVVRVRGLQDDVAGRDAELPLDVARHVRESVWALLVGDRVALDVDGGDHRLAPGPITNGDRAGVDVAQHAGGLVHRADAVATQVEVGQRRGRDVGPRCPDLVASGTRRQRSGLGSAGACRCRGGGQADQ